MALRFSCVLAISLLAAVADASVVRKLTEAQLIAGADLIVTGKVVSVDSQWDARGEGLETHVRIRRQPRDDLVEIVQPGGVVNGDRHVIPGMPVFAVGEAVRVFLRRSLDRPGTYRVYGWTQGKWAAHTVGRRRVYSPEANNAVEYGGYLFFSTNGMVWPPSKIPVAYLIHPAGSDDVALADAKAAIFAAFQTWQDVPCSSLTYTYAGDSSLGVVVDGLNAILWIEQGWIYGAEAAAATSLWIPIEQERTADVAFNGEGFTWAIDPTAVDPNITQDIQGVLTHELGHFSGLGHTQSAVDTMYFAWRPWQNQRTLSADDKLGLCTLYPQNVDECATTANCVGDETCEPYLFGTLCEQPADPVGASCNNEHVECGDFCLFTALDFSTGYCSRFCDTDQDCPPTHHCDAASANGTPVMVCFAGAPSMIDAGPGGPCVTDDDCPGGSFCDPLGLCNFECVSAADCPGSQDCNARGQCLGVDGGGGCGCVVGHRRSGGGWPAGFCVLAVLIGLRRVRGSPRLG